MDEELSPVTSSVTSCNSNATVVLNGAIFSLSSLTGDSDKADYGADKFDLPVSAAGIIPGPDGGLLVDTTKGLVLSVGGELGQLSSLGTTSQVTLNSISSNSDLHAPVQLLGPHDSIIGSSTGQLFEVQSDGISHTSLDGAGDGTTLQLAPIILSPHMVPAPERRKGGWPKGKKRKQEKESNAPKAPATAYVLFAIERRNEIKKSHPELPFHEITKLVGSEWSAMTSQQKQKYLAEAEADKKRYMEELKSYQQSDAYQNFLKRRKLKGLCSEDEGIDSAESSYINDLDEDGLYCKVCNQYFSSVHNRKEHMFGKQHLLAITSEFEKELQRQQDGDAEAGTSDLSQDVATSDSEQSIGAPSFSRPRDTVDTNSFIQHFMEKNYAREVEIQELQKSLHNAKEQNDDLVNKIQIYKEVETKLEQDLGNLKAYGAALSAQIDTLRMVPMLFGVVNF